MKITESNVANHILKSVTQKLGTIYFFNHIAVIEFNEGVHVDINSSSEVFESLYAYFGKSRPFGVVANRVYSYSVKLLDADLFRKKSENVCAYAVVGHDRASIMNAEIENRFCEAPQINYDNLYEALDNVYSRVKDKLLKTLN